jgi:hypothetical protein
MTIIYLTDLPLTYADSFTFENSGTTFQIKILNREQGLTVLLKNIMSLVFSKDSLESDIDYFLIVDIKHEYRIPTEYEMRNYSYHSYHMGISDVPLHIITIFGNSTVDIICEDIELIRLISSP